MISYLSLPHPDDEFTEIEDCLELADYGRVLAGADLPGSIVWASPRIPSLALISLIWLGTEELPVIIFTSP